MSTLCTAGTERIPCGSHCQCCHSGCSVQGRWWQHCRTKRLLQPGPEVSVQPGVPGPGRAGKCPGSAAGGASLPQSSWAASLPFWPCSPHGPAATFFGLVGLGFPGALSLLWWGICVWRLHFRVQLVEQGCCWWQPRLYQVCSYSYIFFTSRAKEKKNKYGIFCPSHKRLAIHTLVIFCEWFLLHMPNEFQPHLRFSWCLNFPAMTEADFLTIAALCWQTNSGLFCQICTDPSGRRCLLRIHCTPVLFSGLNLSVQWCCVSALSWTLTVAFLISHHCK